jgi:hypothetical protein
MTPMGAAGRCGRSVAILLMACMGASCFTVSAGGGGENGPIPFNKIAIEGRDTLIVETLGTLPLGRIPVAGYKVAEFARYVGEAAVEKEDETLRAEVVLMNADAVRLKRLVAAGEGNGAQAKVVKQRLRAHIDRLDSGDPGPINHLLNVTAEHFGYALRLGSVRWGMKLAFKRMLRSDPFLRFWRQAMPLGSETASVIGNRSMLRPWMQAVGWRQFGARADAAERFVDRTTDAYLDALIANTMRKNIADIAGGLLEGMYKEVLADHPPKPVLRQRVRRAIATRPELYVPMLAVTAFVPMPVAPAVAQSVAMVPHFTDPVAQVIGNEERYLQPNDWVVERGGADTYHPPPQPEPEPEPEQVPSDRDLELHKELMCVGAGNKPGCERWNITSDPNVQGNWDGRREGTVYDP